MRFAGNSSVLNFLGERPDFADIGDQSLVNAAMKEMTKEQARAREGQAQIFGDARVDAAKAGAGAISAGGDAAFSAGLGGGISSLASGFAGGFARRPQQQQQASSFGNQGFGSFGDYSGLSGFGPYFN